MRLRRYTPRDLDAVMRVARGFHAESPVHSAHPFDPVKVTQLLDAAWSDPNWLAAIVLDKEEVVGLLLIFCMPMFFGPALEVGDLTFFVVPGRRGTRAAQLMVHEAVQWARSREAAVIRIGVMTGIDHDKAVGFFGHHGFVPTGTIMERRLYS
jgi:GNAT superfamily N-acetyltransferase